MAKKRKVVHGNPGIDAAALKFMAEMKCWATDGRLKNLDLVTLKHMIVVAGALQDRAMAYSLTRLEQVIGGHSGGTKGS